MPQKPDTAAFLGCMCILTIFKISTRPEEKIGQEEGRLPSSLLRTLEDYFE